MTQMECIAHCKPRLLLQAQTLGGSRQRTVYYKGALGKQNARNSHFNESERSFANQTKVATYAERIVLDCGQTICVSVGEATPTALFQRGISKQWSMAGSRLPIWDRSLIKSNAALEIINICNKAGQRRRLGKTAKKKINNLDTIAGIPFSNAKIGLQKFALRKAFGGWYGQAKCWFDWQSNGRKLQE
uniref:Uncharacterized protein n=1 Tax=Trichuris muris TaxID=70415 RepID=A0A5S6R589_TRIMR